MRLRVLVFRKCLKAESESSVPSGPSANENGIMTWDGVYFGKYWQRDTNGDGIVDQSDEKEPIKWRVLSVEGNDAFLMADQPLDCRKYSGNQNDFNIDVDYELELSATWEDCSLRTWLNETFYQDAFSQEEGEAIQTVTVTNEDNPITGVNGGNDTEDEVYLLSLSEAAKAAYGFSTNSGESVSRAAEGTKYAENNDTMDLNAQLFQDYPFTGTLDGRGHKINGFRVQKKYVFSEKITHELLNDDLFPEAAYAVVGALVADGGGEFSNIHVSGKISVQSLRENPIWENGFTVGGIVARGGTMTNCSNSASITVNCKNCANEGGASVGGLSGGYVFKLTKCSNSGNISLSGYCGEQSSMGVAGVLGRTRYISNSEIRNCYNAGNISLKGKGRGIAAGIVGYYQGDWSGKTRMRYNYNVGKITTSNKKITKASILGEQHYHSAEMSHKTLVHDNY